MKRKKAPLVLVALVPAILLGGVGLLIWGAQREPVYDGQPISEWIDELAGPLNPSYGAVSSEALPKLLNEAPGEEIVPALSATLRRGLTPFDRFYKGVYPRLPEYIATELKEPDPNRETQLRYRSALILYYMDEAARGAIGNLVAAVDDPESEVRRMATHALGNMPAQPKVTEALRGALEDPEASVRRAALQSLTQVEAHDLAAQEAARLLEDPVAGVRRDAAQLLKNLGAEAKGEVPALIRALNDEDDDVFRFAVQALGRIGPEAREAVPELLSALREDRPHTRAAIRWALREIAPSALEAEASSPRD